MLVNYGVERFTEVFVGNFDTPEVIWSCEMRQYLIDMIHQHLGDFPQRLSEYTTSVYEYCPLPSVAYQRLEKEFFGDEERYRDWPIANPVEVFRSILEEWKHQMSRDQVKEIDTQENTRKTLKLKSGDGVHQLRKAYRLLARKFDYKFYHKHHSIINI